MEQNNDDGKKPTTYSTSIMYISIIIGITAILASILDFFRERILIGLIYGLAIGVVLVIPYQKEKEKTYFRIKLIAGLVFFITAIVYIFYMVNEINR